MNVPAPVSQLIAKALQREPSHRFQSADELLHAIERVQRTALEPAGQTELKRWLAALAEKDHALPLSRGAENQPAIPLPQDGSSAIELQDEDIVLTTGVSAAPRTSSRWWRAAAVVGIGGAAAFLLLRPTIEPGPIVALVDAGTLEAATEAPVADAGTLEAATEAPLADAGTLEAATEAPLADTRDAGGEVVASSVPTRAPPSRPKPLPAPTPVVADNVSVLIESEPPGALVRIDKNTFGATPLPLRLRIGVAFELVLTKPGHRETRVTYFVTRRANQKVRAVLPKSK
jgi:hypothetical protein